MIAGLLLGLASLTMSTTASACFLGVGCGNEGGDEITNNYDDHSTNQSQTTKVKATSRSSSESSSYSGSSSKAYGGSAKAYGGTAISGGNKVQGGDVSLSVDASDKSTTTYEAPKYAPDVGVDSTAPCMVGIGGSFGNSVFSAGGSGAYKDEECSDLETIRLGLALGDQEIKDEAKALMLEVLRDRMSRRAADRDGAYKHYTVRD